MTVLTWLLYSIEYGLLVVTSIVAVAGGRRDTNDTTHCLSRVLGRVAGLGFVVVVQSSCIIDLTFYGLLSWTLSADKLLQFQSLTWHGPINVILLCIELWMVDMPFEMSYLTLPTLPIIVYWLGWSFTFIVAPTAVEKFPYWFFNFTWLLPIVVFAILLLTVGIHALCVVVIQLCDTSGRRNRMGLDALEDVGGGGGVGGKDLVGVNELEIPSV